MNFTTDLSPRLTSITQPTRFNQYEFPSKKVVPIDWHKLASVDLHELNVGHCTVEVLQEHLNYIAFCQAEEEVHVQNASGQRNILKMFRLAQLIVQYLFISQDYMDSQMNQTKREHQLMLEKYNEMKEKFKNQIEEAKKLKKSNKNMSESIAYMSSLLSSVGSLDHFRCPLCPKAFRSKEFLLSHLHRKHPLQAESVNVSDCFVHVHTNDKTTNAEPSANSAAFLHPQFYSFSNTKPEMEKANLSRLSSSSNRNIHGSNQPSTTRTGSHSVFFADTNSSNMVEAPPPTLNQNHKHHLEVGDTTMQTFRANVTGEMGRSNDVDTYKLQKMQENFNVMNDTVIRLSKDLESQKRLMEMESERRSKELEMSMDEKRTMREDYENIILQLKEKLQALEAKANDSLDKEKKSVNDLLDKQQSEINILKERLREKILQDGQNTGEQREERFLKRELHKLRQELKAAEKKHGMEMRKLQKSFHDEYENALIKEKEEHERQITNLKQINDEMSMTVRSLQARRNNEQIRKPVPKRNTKPSPKRKLERETEMVASKSGFTSRMYRKNQNFRTEDKITKVGNDEEAETEEGNLSIESSETEASTTATKHTEDKQRREGRKQSEVRTMYSRESESSSEEEVVTENFSDGLGKGDIQMKLKELTNKNPGLWNQMREVIEEELSRKLTQFSITEEDKGISREDFKTHLFLMIKMRKTLRDKYEDFTLLRKSLENKIENKLHTATPYKDLPKVWKSAEDCDESEAKGLKGSLRKLTSKLKQKTKTLQRSITSKSDFKVRNNSAIAEKKEKSTNKERDEEDEDDDDDEDEDEDEEDEDDDDDEDEDEDEDEEKGKDAFFKEVSDTSSDEKPPQKRKFAIPSNATPKKNKMLVGTKEREETNEVFRPTSEQEFDTSEDEEPSHETRAEIHTHDADSMNRRRFQDSSPKKVPFYPRRQSFFENMTYGKSSEEEWDSKSASSAAHHEYENLRTDKAQRNDTLSRGNPSRDFAVETIQAANSEIKLRKPTGQMVTELSKKIEHQLKIRSQQKPPGAVDVMGNVENNDDIINQEIKELESIFSDSE